MSYLSASEQKYIDLLKKYKIIRPFSPEDLQKIAPNGAVIVTCGDGDIDILEHHKVAITNRSHKVTLFGGTLCIVPEYNGYDPEEERVIVRTIAKGVLAKGEPGVLFLGHHVICGMALLYGHTVEEVVHLNYLASRRFCLVLKDEINKLLPRDLYLKEELIIDLFHTKKLNDQLIEEQNTYIYCPNLYEECFCDQFSLAA